VKAKGTVIPKRSWPTKKQQDFEHRLRMSRLTIFTMAKTAFPIIKLIFAIFFQEKHALKTNHTMRF